MRKKLIIALLLGSTLTFAVTRYIDQIQSQLAAFVTVLEDELRIGDGGDDDIKISANNGDGSIPYIFYDASSDAFGAANDGSTEDIFALLDASQVLTNKTFDDAITFQELSSTPSTPSSGYKKLYPKDDGTLYTLNDAGEEVPVGTGSGSGGINFITNPDFETNASDWAKYEDAAGVAPVDGDGGTAANLTIARNTTTPLRGDGDFQITKSAADSQGMGISTAFTINNFDKSSIQYIKFDYNTDDDDYDDGDIRVYVYDVTNTNLIELDVRDLPAGEGTYFGTWQAASDSTSYRLILHIATTDANEWDSIFIDNVKAGPVSDIDSPSAVAIGDWKSFTPTGTWTSNTTYEGSYRRVGDTLELDLKVEVSGAPTSVNLEIDLPSGLTIDTSKIPAQVTNSSAWNSWGVIRDVGTAQLPIFAAYKDTNTIRVQYINSSSQVVTVDESAPMTWVSGDNLFLKVTGIPIQGWSAGGNSQAAAVDAARPVEVIYTTNSASKANHSSGIFAYATKVKDTHGAYNSSTGIFTAPRTGYYTVLSSSVMVYAAGDISDGKIEIDSSQVYFKRNRNSEGGTDTRATETSGRFYLEKGQELSIVVDNSSSYGLSSALSRLQIFSSGANSALIDAQSNVNARVSGNAPSATAGNPIIFPTVDWDTNGAYNTSTGEYVAPRSGKIEITGTITSSNNAVGINAAIDGTTDIRIGTTDSAGECNIVGAVSVNQGQAVTIEPGATLDAGATANVSFKYID